MSHTLGSRCETHRWVMVPDNCPECEELHGYIVVPCDARCTENPDYDTRPVLTPNDPADTPEGIARRNRWFRMAVALGRQDDFIELLAHERRLPAARPPAEDLPERKHDTAAHVRAGAFGLPAAGCPACFPHLPETMFRTRDFDDSTDEELTPVKFVQVEDSDD